MTIVYIVIGVIVVLVLGILGLAASRPSKFRVERSIDINTTPQSVFALITDYRRFGSWSPWEHLDPNMKKTFSGPATGKGAVYEWEGNKQVGKGRQEILNATPDSKIEMKLNFFLPFKAENQVEYLIEPSGASTKV